MINHCVTVKKLSRTDLDLLVYQRNILYDQILNSDITENYNQITNNVDEDVQLDVVLDKIRKGGVKILTMEEKNFLDNFQE